MLQVTTPHTPKDTHIPLLQLHTATSGKLLETKGRVYNSLRHILIPFCVCLYEYSEQPTSTGLLSQNYRGDAYD